MPIKGDFDEMWSIYPKGFTHDYSVPKFLDDERIGRLNAKLRHEIGKAVDNDSFLNLCAVRLSFVMNLNGLKIPETTILKWYRLDSKGNPFKFDVKQGADNYYYGHGVLEMYHYILEKYGKPELEINGPFAVWKNGIMSDDRNDLISVTIANQLIGKKGIIIYLVKFWQDAQGHATLWNGEKSVDNNYFEYADKVMLWEVKPKVFSNSVRIHNLNDAIRIIARPIPQDSGQ